MINKKNKLNKRISAIMMITMMVVFTTILTLFMAASVNALADTTRPKIVSVSVVNNEQDMARGEQIMVVFNEYMNSSTINNDTFTVMQRTTPDSGNYSLIAVNGTVTYDNMTATFTPNNLFSPSQQFGNVFTATITTGAKDLAGNSLSEDYVWSSTTGNTPFNTDNTTSQQNQTQNNSNMTQNTTWQQNQTQNNSNVSLPAVVPVTAEPLTPQDPNLINPATSAVTAPNLYWVWIIAGVLFLLLLLALIANRSRTVNTTPKIITRTTRPSPFGDVHPVMAIEGIGPEYSKRLHTMGIKNTKQLWGADAVKVAQQTGASLTAVRSWQNMAELSSIRDIGPQYAELIERSGVHSIDQLKSTNPNELLKLVRQKQESLRVNIPGNSAGHATVEHWIEEARDHKFTEPVEGQTA